jgi:hypothetical protein
MISMKIDAQPNEIISLAIAFDPHWQLIEGKGILVGDTFGNTVLIPTNTGEQIIRIAYKRTSIDIVIPTLFIICIILLLYYLLQYLPFIHKTISRASLGIHDEDEY